MSLPPLAPIPPASVRLSLAPEEWSACLDAWIALADLTVRLPSKELSSGAKTTQTGLITFLRSFYHESSTASPTDETLRDLKALQLQKTCFRLVARVCSEVRDADNLLDWDFLVAFCHLHIKSSALPRLIGQVWKQHRERLESVIRPQNSSITKKLDSSKTDGVSLELQRLAPVLRASPDLASLLMTGSDFLDGLTTFHANRSSTEERRAAVLILYLGLESLVKVEPQSTSLLSDHLFSLKASADSDSSKDSILADLVTNTPLLNRLRRSVTGKGAERLSKLLDSLETYRTSSLARPRKRVRRKPEKGKGRAPQLDGEMHMHRMSLVTQVQDLFPDLGSGFIMKLLDEYNDDVEQATAHLLDDSLPSHLQSLDRTEEASLPISAAGLDDLAPKSTPPPEPASYIPDRRNVFDEEELDFSRLQIGKKDKDAQPTDTNANKSAILSALAAFDADDDERDDTYDVDDVGGTIDTSAPDGEPGPNAKASREENDAALFKVYKSSPELLGRTFDVRRGQPRQALKRETGMTDEAIEGWAIMLQRNPKQMSRLESQFGGAAGGGFDGRQTALERTAYRESPGGTETEDSDAPKSGSGAPNAPRGGFRGRARGRGRGRGGGGSVAGPSGDAGTAAAQRRKEESKGSRANHNRRDQRAKKMGRGMG